MIDYSNHNPLIYTESTRNEMLDFIPQTAQKILDVGCSAGRFGELIKEERSVEIWGVELDESASSIASERLDKVICGTFDQNINLPSDYFDCIVFNDVLEHMVDPYNALNFAKSLLSENGKIVASIPNVRYFDNIWKLVVHKEWNYTESGILDITHLRFFTLKSIKSTFKKLGYKIDLIKGINPLEKCDPYYMRKFNFLNLISFKKIEDMRWLQFAVVASPLK